MKYGNSNEAAKFRAKKEGYLNNSSHSEIQWWHLLWEINPYLLRA